MLTVPEFSKGLVRAARTVVFKPLSKNSVFVARNAKSFVQRFVFTQCKQHYASKDTRGVMDVYL